MAEITIELSKNPGKYSFQKLLPVLKRQFGRPKPVHWKAWAAFKKKCDEYEEQAPSLPSSYANSMARIVAIEPKVLPEV